MRPATLTYVNLFVRDLGTLPDFYARLFGFTEIPEMRNPVFRGFDTGASSIGFMAPEVYGVLELQEHRAGAGTSLFCWIRNATCSGSTPFSHPDRTRVPGDGWS
jgi:hypothetical protein